MLFRSAKTPRSVVDRLNSEIQKLLQDQDLLARFEREGGQPIAGTADKYAAYMRSELERWGRLVKRVQ